MLFPLKTHGHHKWIKRITVTTNHNCAVFQCPHRWSAFFPEMITALILNWCLSSDFIHIVLRMCKTTGNPAFLLSKIQPCFYLPQPSLCIHCKSQDQLVIYSYGQPFNVTSVYMPGTFFFSIKVLWLNRKIRIHNHRNISDRSSEVLETLSARHKVFNLWIPQQHQRLKLHSGSKQHRVCFCILVVYVTIALLLNKEAHTHECAEAGRNAKDGREVLKLEMKKCCLKSTGFFPAA